MSVVAVDPALAAELWVSFVSLVRSYAGVAGLSGGFGVEVSAVGDSIQLSAGAVECAMQFASESGAVVWSLRDGQEASSGRFELRPDGKIEQDGADQEMDSVAIDMVAQVRDRAQAGQKGRR